MKSITIHGLDDALDRLIREKAENEGLSLNKTIKKLLRKALGLYENGIDHRDDFEKFSGQWSDKDLVEFNQQTKEFNVVDDGDWQ
jgi:predicted CopG family antitoxin